AQIAKSTGKVSGIVIDDAAVTPKYVVGLDPKRELAIIWNIAKSSLFNKIVLLAPLALLLGWLAPWLIPPLLMIGGAFLCFEGYEKVHTVFSGHGQEAAEDENTKEISPEELEKIRTNSAIRTDFILSAEIIAITYSTVADLPLSNQIAVLAAIGIGITVVVYGVVGLIVKADDFGVWLARSAYTSFGKGLGRFIVKAMPKFLIMLAWIGTAAMLWVGAGIIVHGIPITSYWLHALHDALAANATLALIAEILVLMVAGLVFGFLIALVTTPVLKFIKKRREAQAS
ncbi:MAG: DUF808 domain-containing protein, partial [Hyphomicrobiales bacterium]